MKFRLFSLIIFPVALTIFFSFYLKNLESRPADEKSEFQKLFSGQTDLVWVMINVSAGEPQGDAHLILGKDGQAILIDTGVQEEGEACLIPFLKSVGVNHLRQVFITHPHFDHYGGLKPLLQETSLAIDEIFLAPVSEELCKAEWYGCSLEALVRIRSAAEKRGIPIRDYSAWEKTEFQTVAQFSKLVQFTEKSTPLPSWTDINDMSLIAKLQHGSTVVLFTGDLNNRLSDWLVQQKWDVLKADILKVPHHGTESLASDAFFDAVSAKNYLVPSPKKLWCSERSSRVRERVKQQNIPAYVNGIHGNVIVRFSPTGYSIETENSVTNSDPCE